MSATSARNGLSPTDDERLPIKMLNDRILVKLVMLRVNDVRVAAF